FLPELYDRYWDTSQEPHQARKAVRAPFHRLVEIRNNIVHLLPPANKEAWQALGEEAESHLRTILEQFSFLQYYDLIRIIGLQGHHYEYERFMGQEITTHSAQLRGKPKEEQLRPGWIYLCRQDRVVLSLHPLLVSWSYAEEP